MYTAKFEYFQSLVVSIRRSEKVKIIYTAVICPKNIVLPWIWTIIIATLILQNKKLDHLKESHPRVFWGLQNLT